MEHCFTWLRDLDTNKIGVKIFGELRNLVLEENGEQKMPEKLINKKVIGRIGENRTLLNNIRYIKDNWFIIILRPCHLHDVIKGQTTEIKGLRERT